MKNMIQTIVRWALSESPERNQKRHSLIKWLAFHGGLQ